VTLHLRVKPGSKVDQVFYDAAGKLNIKIKAPVRDGQANAYLIEFLAKQLGVAKSGITLVSGFTTSHKRLEIDVSQAVADDFLRRIEQKRGSGKR
jgi:hypothetical protein